MCGASAGVFAQPRPEAVIGVRLLPAGLIWINAIKARYSQCCNDAISRSGSALCV